MPVAYVGAAVAAGSLINSVVNQPGAPNSQGQTVNTNNGFQVPPVDQSQAINSFMHMYGTDQPYFDALPGMTFPGLYNASSNMQNNPYAGMAQQGANWASSLATGMPMPGMPGPGANFGAPSIPGNPMTGGPAGNAGGGTGPLSGFTPNINQPMLAGGNVGGMMMANPANPGPGLTGQPGMPGAGGNPAAGLPQQGMFGMPGASPGMPGGVAGMQFGGAGQLYGAGNQIMSQAFDPQQQLYNRTQQQLMDQINAANAASGVSGPAAAGVSQQGLTNFNIDWQNNLLNRELQGATGAGRAFTGASDLGQLGLGTLTSGTAQPYNTYNAQQQQIIAAINALSGGAQNVGAANQTQGNPWLSILGLAQTPTLTSSNTTSSTPYANQQQLGQGFASLLSNPTLQSGINSLFGPSYASPSSVGAVTSGDITGIGGGLDGGFSSGGY